MATLTGTASPEALLPTPTTGVSHVRGVTAAGGSIQHKTLVISPFHYGAVGDGTADDTVALNAVFTAARAAVVSSQHTHVKIDMSGGIYKITGSGINGTGFQAWNLEICGGVLLGNTTGKAVLDMAGSRGYVMRNVMITGDATNMPTVGILCARTTTSFGYCDNCLFDNVNIIGHFSVATFFGYAQETTTHLHCRYWQYNYDASIVIWQRSNTYTLTSEFQTLVTGAHSFINCAYITCDIRYGGSTHRNTVTAISNAAEAVVAVSGTNIFQNGDEVIMFLATGMTQINAYKAVVKDRTASQFTMTGVDSSAFGAFTGSCYAYRPMTGPGIYMSGMQDHRFINCYLVAIGDDAIQMDCNTGIWISNTFQFLNEGALDRSVVRVTSGAGVEEFIDCTWDFYNTHCRTSFFSTDGAQTIYIKGGSVKVKSHTTNVALPLADTANYADYAFINGVDIFYPNIAGVAPSSYGAFRAKLTAEDNGGEVALYRHELLDTRNVNYTPAVVATTNVITTLGTCSGRIRFKSENLAYFAASAVITTNGPATGEISIPMPAGITGQAAQKQALNAFALTGTTRTACVAELVVSGTSIKVVKYDGTYPGANATTIIVTGEIETA